jgi:hypothetical protein
VRPEPVHVIGELSRNRKRKLIEVVYFLLDFLLSVSPMYCDYVAKAVHMHGTNISNAMLVTDFLCKAGTKYFKWQKGEHKDFS